MTHTFTVPVEIDAVSMEELSLTAAEIADILEANGIPLAGDVKPWLAPTLTAPAQQLQPPSQNF